MDWESMVIGFGLLALICFAVSVGVTIQKWYTAGLVFGVLEFIAASVSAFGWAGLLNISGHPIAFLLSLLTYPMVGAIFLSMFGVGVLCIMINMRGIKKSKESAHVSVETQA